ncbi:MULTISPECIES: hypothetical protein [Cryobacterium]|uniref:Uncharacterized protein n=1 Tax=Cryobacterium breve TaxID=1259258 RepID=A0ABY2JAJ2_9MICO|nr:MULTISPECIES: hypothetical protein [Cryobacterium]TFC90418.1 hypothetical protein E3T20_16405 [Cryobacterium sp. TmT3-12]TFD01835.1 hypothetical protein E3O65_00600 [Cryobacterium breve]
MFETTCADEFGGHVDENLPALAADESPWAGDPFTRMNVEVDRSVLEPKGVVEYVRVNVFEFCDELHAGLLNREYSRGFPKNSATNSQVDHSDGKTNEHGWRIHESSTELRVYDRDVPALRGAEANVGHWDEPGVS